MKKNIKQLTEKGSHSDHFGTKCWLSEKEQDLPKRLDYNNRSIIRDRIQELLNAGWKPVQPLPLDWSFLQKDNYEVTVFMEAPADE